MSLLTSDSFCLIASHIAYFSKVFLFDSVLPHTIIISCLTHCTTVTLFCVFQGCFRLGDFFAAMKKDFKQAADAYQKSCEEYNYGKGCQKVGALYMYGYGE